jgi:hypothetical protein
MSESPLLACVIAIELDPAVEPARRLLNPGEAGQLAAHVMADLAERLPQVERSGLVLAGALYDATELMQPQWPLFRELKTHYLRGAGADARLMGLGQAEGRMPTARFEPDPRRAGAALTFVPFVLVAPEDIAAGLGEALETLLVGSGQLGAASALGLQTLFGLKVQHAQYFTRYDLCALMAAQLDPLGLAPLWALLECALLSPQDEVQVVDGQGGRWSFSRGRVRSGFTGYADWLASDAGQAALAEGRVADAFADALLVQRQYLAVLRAHGVEARWPDGRWESLIEVTAPGTPGRVRAVRLPQLGLAALLALDGDSLVGIGFPFSDDGLGEIGPVFEALADVEDLHAWPVDPATGRLWLPPEAPQSGA